MKVIRAETQTDRKPDLADGSPPGGRLPGISSEDRPDRFTDTELQAAVNLVLLSESSSASSMGKEFRHQQHRPDAAARGLCGAHSRVSSAASSSLASVNTTHPAACGGGSADDDEVGESGGTGSDSDPMVDEDTTGPWARVRRYRSLRGLYLVTDRMDGAIRTLAAAGRKRKAVPEPTLPALQLRTTVTERTKRKSRV